MVIFTPLLTGIFYGVNAVSGLLIGALIASVQLAISMSNSGGAWDNAKKYIEKQPADSELQGKGSDIHKAAVVGDTVGDPFKDTSGPALNIVMKVSTPISITALEISKFKCSLTLCLPLSSVVAPNSLWPSLRSYLPIHSLLLMEVLEFFS
jgi:Na+/H+-translocating membrane pyrophosphatase